MSGSIARAYAGLAYEIVINSDPCISYYMEENTMAMQTLVLAHAAFGHNHFFKQQLPLQGSGPIPKAILDYLEYRASGYITSCEERHGEARRSRRILDCRPCADGPTGVFRFRRPARLKLKRGKAARQRERDRHDYEDQTFNDLWRTLPKSKDASRAQRG